MLIRGAEVEGVAGLALRIENGTIEELSAGLDPRPGEAVLDAAGGALVPGLHDHHIHLFALAQAEHSLGCGPPRVRSATDLHEAVRRAAASEAGDSSEMSGAPIRGVGYHESVAGPLDRWVLDGWLVHDQGPPRELMIQHRSGALWIVSSALVERLGLDHGVDAPGVERDSRGRSTGRLFRLDAWLRERLPRATPPGLSTVGARLAQVGVTGVTDTTPGNGATELAAFERAVGRGELPQRLVLMGAHALPLPGMVGIERGAVKIQLDESALPELADLASSISRAHDDGRGAAIHGVTRVELIFAAAAFREAGVRAGDRIEHASVASPEVARLVAELGLTVVTQPNFVRERGDAYRVEVEPGDQPWLYRCRGWDELEVPLGGGTDAPFGEPDPWLAMQAAVDRRTAEGHALGAGEALTPERALALFTTGADAPGGRTRRVAVGQAADLCLLDRPWRLARDELAADQVRATVRAGRVLWDRLAAPGCSSGGDDSRSRP